MSTTGSDSLTLEIDCSIDCPENSGGHDFSGTLGCAEHAYQHRWGHYCVHCFAQAFYADLGAMCERGIDQ